MLAPSLRPPRPGKRSFHRAIATLTSGICARRLSSSKSMLMGNGRTCVTWPRAGDLTAVGIDPRLDGPVHRVEEILAVVVDVESHQVVS